VEQHLQDVPEQAKPTFERAALESRIQEAGAFKVSAPDQAWDTPLHPQASDKPDCLLQSARMCEERQTGCDPGLAAYKVPALERGLYDPNNGTSIEGFAEVIDERPGLEADLVSADGPQEIKDALDEGQSVIAAVDAYEFYKGRFNLEPSGAGHAVVVTGADEMPDGEWEFTVNDPNFESPNMRVDGQAFLRAWKNTDRQMITVARSGGA